MYDTIPISIKMLLLPDVAALRTDFTRHLRPSFLKIKQDLISNIMHLSSKYLFFIGISFKCDIFYIQKCSLYVCHMRMPMQMRF